MWRVPLMTSCAVHGCQLEPESDIMLAALADSEATTPSPQHRDACRFSFQP
jgi:hypothetical protein